jgi:DNA ligase-1
MLGKTFKGSTDEILAWQTKRLQEIATERGDRGAGAARFRGEIAFNESRRARTIPAARPASRGSRATARTSDRDEG